MAVEVKTYDANDVTVTVGGIYLTGFSEDLVTVSKDEEGVSTKVGAQGDVAVSKVNNPLGTISVTLLQTSPQVAYLNKLARSGQMVPVSVIYSGDPKEVSTANEAIVKKPADREYSAEVGDRSFEFQCLDLDMN
ncbi:hypothetical protein PSTEL_09675 [Paenibacillus stellifer]|uniref:DUF3277 domain-containing protein n=1 Tax=Paenibacillus stellifer TaxID=169760 RepID=A0A089LT85_9BACL|nr:phage protein [Paenibacillus stellifer]AIQ63315.1 hypothetical protein PSTEL_09675 [Paenibacillus stellifer]